MTTEELKQPDKKHKLRPASYQALKHIFEDYPEMTLEKLMEIALFRLGESISYYQKKPDVYIENNVLHIYPYTFTYEDKKSPRGLQIYRNYLV